MVSKQPKMNHSNTHRTFITLYCSRATQTMTEPDNSEDNSETEASTEHSDFPPCRIGNMSPIMFCPLPDAHCSHYPPRATASSVQLKQPTIMISSSEEPEESPQSHHYQQLNTGLGQANILNTVNTKVLLFFPTCNKLM